VEGRTEAQQRREARIRRGTLAPGPAPRGSTDDPALLPGPGETLDRLAGDFCIFQLRGGHRYSTDDLLCAYFACEAAERLGVRVRRALDLGSGIGSVALLLAWRLPDAAIDGIEAQAVSVALARRSIVWNGVEARVRVLQGDLREASVLPRGPADLVTGTPPYFGPHEGTLSPAVQRGPCRFELRGGVENYVSAAAHALAPAGVAVLVHVWRERGRVLAAARDSGLAAALVQPVLFKEGRAPALGLFAFSAGAWGQELPPLIVRQADGSYSEAFRDVRRKMGYPLEQGFEPFRTA
jgi:tRNA1Val (adenine37-N6)-methyltransferase